MNHDLIMNASYVPQFLIEMYDVPIINIINCCLKFYFLTFESL